MKKKFLNLMLITLGIFTVLTINSCGDDDDSLGLDDEVQQDETASFGYKYVEPCLQWKASPDVVKAYMDKQGDWDMTTEVQSNSTTDLYQRNYPLTMVTYCYGLLIDGLISATVVYFSNEESEFADLRNTIETTYGCRLEKIDSEVGEVYSAENVKINGRPSSIRIMSYTDEKTGIGEMSVAYVYSLN